MPAAGMTALFDQPIKTALSLSDSVAQAFARAGVHTVRDVLFHLPLRYEDRSRLTPVAALRDGQTALVHGRVVSATVQQGRRQILKAVIADAAGDLLHLVYFRFYPSILQQYKTGRFGLFYGKVRFAGQFGYQMAHPEVTWLEDGAPPQLPERLLAVYPTAKGLTQIRWQQAQAKALALLGAPAADPLTREGYPALADALAAIHQPEAHAILPSPENPEHPALQRLIIEELTAHQLSLLTAREQLRWLPAPKLPENSELIQRFLTQLPFTLTPAQARVAGEISADLSREDAMLRLVQGDVGSGKTVVALLACLQAAAAGKQAVFMAPTELLAEQHAGNMRRLLGDLPVRTALLVSKLGAKEKRKLLAEIAAGEIDLIIGTHAVFQEQVQYRHLALAAIDEQHRFGVHQRLQLQGKVPAGFGVHQLILTATPIPRTLAMSAYGELDTSIIDALPAGRKPIRTSVVANDKRAEVIRRLGAVCAGGAQAYWVCPLIEESDVLECENAEATREAIASALPQLRVALVHGRLDAETRRQTMAAFAAGEIDILVATTVIEVGVDVPNASLMIIENAERFGLSQLHQLRGRVGRGSAQSDCLLMYQAPLGQVAKRRLSIMRETADGFVIAEEDLAIRGAGELLGTRQTGEAGLRIASLERDALPAEKAQRYAASWQHSEPAFVRELTARWIGDKVQYIQV